MEREIWLKLMRKLDGLRNRRPRRCQFTDHDIVRVFLWAVLHDRPVSWACQRTAWHGRRQILPSSATMSRRMRSLSVLVLLRRLSVVHTDTPGLLCIDGKPLPVSRFTKDKQARRGHGAGGPAKGYKFHATCDRRGRVIAFTVQPMNVAEQIVGRRLLARSVGRGTVVLADSSYDSNALHAVASMHKAVLLAPRRRPGTGLGHRDHDPGRLHSIAVLEDDRRKRRQVARLRTCIERTFGWLTMNSGGTPPPWVRTKRRVARWIMAKVAIVTAKACAQ